jgi:hypothetical protein
MQILCLCSVLITIQSIIDLVKYSRNSPLFDCIIALFGIVSIICWLIIENIINKIKKIFDPTV